MRNFWCNPCWAISKVYSFLTTLLWRDTDFICNIICSDIIPLRSSLMDPTSSTPPTSWGLSCWTPQLTGGGRGLTTSSRVSLPLGICLEFYSLTLTHLTPLVKANDATYPLTPLKRKLMNNMRLLETLLFSWYKYFRWWLCLPWGQDQWAAEEDDLICHRHFIFWWSLACPIC